MKVENYNITELSTEDKQKAQDAVNISEGTLTGDRKNIEGAGRTRDVSTYLNLPVDAKEAHGEYADYKEVLADPKSENSLTKGETAFRTQEEKLFSVMNRITESDYTALSAEGISVDDLDVDTLEAAVERVKLKNSYKTEIKQEKEDVNNKLELKNREVEKTENKNIQIEKTENKNIQIEKTENKDIQADKTENKNIQIDKTEPNKIQKVNQENEVVKTDQGNTQKSNKQNVNVLEDPIQEKNVKNKEETVASNNNWKSALAKYSINDNIKETNQDDKQENSKIAQLKKEAAQRTINSAQWKRVLSSYSKEADTESKPENKEIKTEQSERPVQKPETKEIKSENNEKSETSDKLDKSNKSETKDVQSKQIDSQERAEKTESSKVKENEQPKEPIKTSEVKKEIENRQVENRQVENKQAETKETDIKETVKSEVSKEVKPESKPESKPETKEAKPEQSARPMQKLETNEVKSENNEKSETSDKSNKLETKDIQSKQESKDSQERQEKTEQPKVKENEQSKETTKQEISKEVKPESKIETKEVKPEQSERPVQKPETKEYKPENNEKSETSDKSNKLETKDVRSKQDSKDSQERSEKTEQSKVKENEQPKETTKEFEVKKETETRQVENKQAESKQTVTKQTETKESEIKELTKSEVSKELKPELKPETKETKTEDNQKSETSDKSNKTETKDVQSKQESKDSNEKQEKTEPSKVKENEQPKGSEVKKETETKEFERPVQKPETKEVKSENNEKSETSDKSNKPETKDVQSKQESKDSQEKPEKTEQPKVKENEQTKETTKEAEVKKETEARQLDNKQTEKKETETKEIKSEQPGRPLQKPETKEGKSEDNERSETPDKSNKTETKDIHTKQESKGSQERPKKNEQSKIKENEQPKETTKASELKKGTETRQVENKQTEAKPETKDPQERPEKTEKPKVKENEQTKEAIKESELKKETETRQVENKQTETKQTETKQAEMKEIKPEQSERLVPKPEIKEDKFENNERSETSDKSKKPENKEVQSKQETKDLQERLEKTEQSKVKENEQPKETTKEVIKESEVKKETETKQVENKQVETKESNTKEQTKAEDIKKEKPATKEIKSENNEKPEILDKLERTDKAELKDSQERTEKIEPPKTKENKQQKTTKTPAFNEHASNRRWRKAFDSYSVTPPEQFTKKESEVQNNPELKSDETKRPNTQQPSKPTEALEQTKKEIQNEEPPKSTEETAKVNEATSKVTEETSKATEETAATKETQQTKPHLQQQPEKEPPKQKNEEPQKIKKHQPSRIDRQSALSRYAGNNQINKQMPKTDVQESTQSQTLEKEQLEKITDKLEEKNLPATEANIRMISNALALSESLQGITEDVARYLVDNSLEPTIENIYKATYSKSSQYSYDKKQEVSEEVWKQLKEQAENILKEAELEVSKENLKIAKWLLDNKLPLTEETIKETKKLREIKELPKDEQLLERIVSTLAEGKSAAETSLDTNDISYQTKEIVQKVQEITDEAVEETVNRQEEITIKNLNEVQKQLDTGIKLITIKPIQLFPALIPNQLPPKIISDDKNMEIITAKRQIEQIRLKMTIEAGQKLLGKGLNIETMKLSKVVEELVELENDYFKQVLKEGNVKQSDENVTILRETSEKIDSLKGMPNYIIGMTLQTQDIETITSLHTTGEIVKGQLDKANETYDALMTKPRSDMGDSIKKAFRNVDSLLEEINLEPTAANQRAVRILGYNNMEITPENITKVKQYDLQVNDLMANLHPAITVHMIREGINPLKKPISELNEDVRDIRKELDITEEEKFSKYLWKLDQDKAITPEERKSFIGIYRLLNQVEKTDGKALGALVKADCEVTLDNLLTSVRTIKAAGIDAKIDAGFGEQEKVTFKQETITQQINSSFIKNPLLNEGQQNEVKYMQTMLYNILDEISPSNLKDISGTRDIANMSLESLKEALQNASKQETLNKEYVKQQIDNLRNIASSNEKAIHMLTSNRIPVTINNLIAANALSTDKGFVFREINNRLKKATKEEKESVKNTMDGLSEKIEDKEAIDTQYENLEADLNKLLNKEYASSTLTSRDIIKLKTLTNGISLLRSLSKEENYEIPLEINGRFINMSVKIISGAKDSGHVNISLSSEKIGEFTADFSVKNGEIRGIVTCDDKNSIKMLRDNDKNLRAALEEKGLNTKFISYITGNKKDIVPLPQEAQNTEESGQKESTPKLYQLAKAFVIAIKKMEI